MGSAAFFPWEEGPGERPGAAGGSAAVTSVNPFHVPHSGHRPSHRGSWWLQPEHSNTVFDFDTRSPLSGEDRSGRRALSIAPDQ